MSSDLEDIGAAMFDGRVPADWMAHSWPSCKPLASYINDLVERTRMMQVGMRCFPQHGGDAPVRVAPRCHKPLA